ncbi:MAG: aminoacetone oxidase family FAD-binding enzyme [Legionellales bacterium]|nr:aminoacetone oxidase family FAD-binding enzyme [Legionellales bacterium]
MANLDTKTPYDCIVIGGGAAGLMCAATAAYRGRRVLLFDHANKMGKKILMSGGGRCNFTNLNARPENFISNNPHFCKSALKRYTPYDFLTLVDSYNLVYHEKTPGQLFCSNSAKDLLNILFSECDKTGVQRVTSCSVNEIQKTENGFAINTSHGLIKSESLVIATGGLSIPTMGATGFGYEVAEQFGLTLYPREAALVPFVVKDGQEKQLCQNLSGLSFNVSVECSGKNFKEPMLFTHRGLSGPAILQISSYWNKGDSISVDCLPDTNLCDYLLDLKRHHHKLTIKNALMILLPKRFVEEKVGDEWKKTADQFSDEKLNILANQIQSWHISPVSTEGYRTAEVTRGGINTDHISSKTFEAKNVPGLYFIGEVLDVTGWLGGYNFQWAWSSAWCAGQYV